MDTAGWYNRFADVEARDSSPSYAALAAGVASDEHVLDHVEQLPARKRQPNLLFASVRFLDGPTSNWNDFRSFVLDNWASVSSVMRDRSTRPTRQPAVQHCSRCLADSHPPSR